MSSNCITDFINLRSHHFEYRTNSDPVTVLPEEVILEIFSFLNGNQLSRCLLVNQTWKRLTGDQTLWNKLILNSAFGKKHWETHFGEVGEEPPLPKNILKILKGSCPFFQGKRVEETHVLVLVPTSVNGKPLNLTVLGELVKAPKKGHATQYRCLWDKLASQSPAKSHWALMTKTVIPESTNKIYLDQRAFMAQLCRQACTHYEIPNVLDAAVCILMQHVRAGKRLFPDELRTYTSCQEIINGFRVVIGGFSRNGLAIKPSLYPGDNKFANEECGVAAMRKFF